MSSPSRVLQSDSVSPLPGDSPLSPKWFFAFFLVSGFCSLVYEEIWLRLAVAKFGITTPLVSIVLSVFMAGLGLGSWLGGRWLRTRRDLRLAVLLRSYASLELIIGISGLAVPALLTFGYVLLRDAGAGFAWGSGLFYLFSGLWIGVIMLPWCTAMGATFPFAMAAMQHVSAPASTRSFSYLYLANVIGAVAGTLVPAFVLIELLGFHGTLLVASCCNVLLASAVMLLSFSYRLSNAFRESSARPKRHAPASTLGQGLLWQLFATGLCSMALEVVWIRQFTVYLGNVVYAFALILALYLAATFTGSALYRRSLNASRNYRVAWIALGLAAVLPLLFADPRLPIPQAIDVSQTLYLGALRTALGIVPFSLAVGFITPMLVDRWSDGDPDRAGFAYAINVVGSIVGPLIAGFLLVPLAGERWGLLLIALPLFALAWSIAEGAQARTWWAVTAVAATSLAVFTADYSIKFSNPIQLRDHTATVIAAGQGMHKRLLVNGTGMTKLTPITKMMAHLPLAFLDHPAKTGLVICMGMGTTFRSMLAWGIDATVVELVPSVPKLFAFFHPDAPALLAGGKGHIVVDDGRRFLERSHQQFDVMAIDPPPPIGAPTSSLLYSLEFYRTVKQHLKPDGLFQVWCPGGDRTTNAAITKAIQQSFPYVRAFTSLENWGTHYLVSLHPIRGDDPDALAAQLPSAARRDINEFNPNWTPAEMFDDALAGERDVAQLAALDPRVPPITDDRAVNEYFLLRSAMPASH